MIIDVARCENCNNCLLATKDELVGNDFPGYSAPHAPQGRGVLRIERHVANAQKVAEYLEGHDVVVSVNYAGLPSSPWHERAKKLAPKGTGAVLSFELAGGIEAGKAFVNALKLHSHVANIGDVRSLVIHPASTTHQQLSAEEQLATGVTPGLVRLAVGLEGIDDILADLERGFAAARSLADADASDPRAVAAF